MRLHAHRSAEAFLAALKSTRCVHYAIFDRSATSAIVLHEVEALANRHSHVDVIAEAPLRTAAEYLLRAYFDGAARTDSHAAFAYSSRVLLAVPDYPDVALLFVLRALEAREPDATLHALIEDPWKAALALSDFNGGAPPDFKAPVRRGLARAGRSFGRSLLAKHLLAAPDVLVFTLGDALSNGGTDTYFGDLAESLGSRCRVATVYLAPGKRLRLRSDESVAPLEAFLKPADALAAYVGVQSVRASHGPSTDALTAFLQAREYASGEVVMLNVIARALEHMFAQLKPKTVVYPFENRTWEKHLLRAARRHGVRRCIGYQHSSLTPRHLAFSGAAGLAGMADLPDAIITCGTVTAELISANIPQARSLVVAGAALRAARQRVPPPSGWGVLAPISSSRAEAWEILRVLHKYSRSSSGPIIVRMHPAIPAGDLFAAFDWPEHVMLSNGRTLAEDFAATAIVLYSSATVALEGMLYGRLPIYLDIGDVPSGDPIQGDHRFVTKVRTAPELTEAVLRISGSGDSDLASLREEARAYAERYLVEPTRENIQRMAETIAGC